MMGATASDVLRWPLVGPFLRWRHARTALRLVLLFVAILLVVHGLWGSQVAPANLATVLPWIHYRGLLIVALLVAGSLFCTACPFVLVRDAGRRLWSPLLRWPRWLRVKWLGIGLFVLVLFAYEQFDLWSLPAATAWLVLGYFGMALAIDLLFTGATFCKHLCPIGQFSFAGATMSPLEIRVRQPATCLSCRTVDCIKGRRDPVRPQRVVQRGCELALFLPSKVGNLDCTFCLDCVQACPHDNVALATRLPGLELADPRRRSGIGWLQKRADLAVLAVVFVFAGLLNAIAMTAPGYAIQRWAAGLLALPSEGASLAAVFVLALVVLPVVLLSGAAALTAWVSGAGARGVRPNAVSYAYALIPLGFGVWLSHYGFHLLTGALTFIPVTQAAMFDLTGAALLGEPLWQLTGMRPGRVLPIQLGVILIGTAGSFALAYIISERDHSKCRMAATVPWALVIAVLSLAALWIAFQPMDMRGVSFPG